MELGARPPSGSTRRSSPPHIGRPHLGRRLANPVPFAAGQAQGSSCPGEASRRSAQARQPLTRDRYCPLHDQLRRLALTGLNMTTHRSIPVRTTTATRGGVVLSPLRRPASTRSWRWWDKEREEFTDSTVRNFGDWVRAVEDVAVAAATFDPLDDAASHSLVTASNAARAVTSAWVAMSRTRKSGSRATARRTRPVTASSG